MTQEIENVQVKPAHDPDSRYGQDEPAEPKEHPMDTPAAHTKFSKLMDWYTQERERQAANRYQMALDEDFYDGLQWSEEDIQELADRGQAAYVYNKIKPTIDWIIGTEKRTRIDFKVLPREEDDVDGAEIKTKLLKYLSDVNMTPFHRSQAFADQVKAGVGWLESGIRSDPEEELLYSRSESWRNIIYDSSSRDLDMKDARFIFRHRWVDLDISEAYFPDRLDKLRQSAIGSDLFNTETEDDLWYLGQQFQARDAKGEVVGRRSFVSDAQFNNRRERVKLIECWYRLPVCARICQGRGIGAIFNSKKFDSSDQSMVAAFKGGYISLIDTVRMRVRCAIMTENHMLVDTESPYKHNRFPFTPLWCYRRARDNAPYGAIRNIRDPQEDLNKRASKALFILSTNRIEGEVGAVDDWEELRAEAARPDSVIVRNKGSLLEINRDTALAEEHLMLMDRDAQMIQDVAGVTDDNLGRKTNAASGVAIQSRQDQGSIVTAPIFDNMRLSLQLEGELELSLMEQFYTEPKIARIVGSRGKLDWIKINQAGKDGEILNDITQRKADFIIGEQDFRQSLRMAMFETLSEMVAKLPPEIAIQLLDLVWELSDAPNKDEAVARIRRISGQRDPDAKLSPEEMKAQEDKAKQDAEKAAAEKRMFYAEVATLLAKAQKDSATATNLQVDSTSKAAEAAAALAQSPELAKLIEILVQKSAQDAVAGAPSAEPPALPPPAMTPDMQEQLVDDTQSGPMGP